MAPLHKKLLRDARRLWAQVLAIALVLASGVATFILGAGAYQSLAMTRAAYYESNRFADVFAEVTRAPKALAAEIAAIPGVAVVEPRIAKIAMTDIPGMAEPASVLVLSLPDVKAPELNQLYLRSGRLPEMGRAGEAVVNDGFAKAHGISSGGTVTVLLNGIRRTLRVTGVVLSPEFIYALGPGDLMPDERRFGIVWMRESEVAAAYGLTGAFSSLAIKLLPGANEQAVIAAVDAKLTRYGGQGAYGRKDQLSHAFLDAELQQLNAMSKVLPPIFLVVAAFLVNMTLTRLITLEREQIGLLKALGYSSWAVARHYIGFVAVIAVIGIAIGFVAGALLGNGMAVLYSRFFHFPFLMFSRAPELYVIGAAITLAAAVGGALRAVNSVAFLPPAVAMSPPAPAQFHKFLGGRLSTARLAHKTAVMIARHLLHQPWRSASSILGAAFAVAILVGSLWSFGSINKMIDVTFFRADRQDATIAFTSARPLPALYAVQHLPGVIEAEPYRAVAVKMSAGHISRRLALTGKPSGNTLSRVLDKDLKPATMPEKGVLLSRALADILNVRAGDTVQVEVLEGSRRSFSLPVSSVVEGYIGLMAFMDMSALNAALREREMISGVHISIDPVAQSQLFAALKATPQASFIALEKVSLEKFRSTLAQNITTMITVYGVLAGIIAFGVVYNFARISLSEQGRELASLRVLGFTRGEVSRLLLAELAIVVILAQPLGWLLGYLIGFGMASAFASELYNVPFVVGREVYAYASLVVFAAALFSGLLVRRRIDNLDMIAVLKTRE
jgi:putative ABC transport system permease protein